MALSIKHPEADRMARELSRVTGETMTQAVVVALRERLSKVKNKPDAGLVDEIMEIGRRCAAAPELDHRSADEILGYDENGLPT